MHNIRTSNLSWKVRWKNFHSIRTWRKSRFQREANKTKLFSRLDGITVLIILSIVILVTLFCYGSVKILQRVGVFDDALVQQVRDERKLNNFWEERHKSPILDGVYHHYDGRIYISSQAGEIHHYDPRTKLWGTETFPSYDGLITPDFDQLRSGSGATKNAIFSFPVEPDLIWALNAKGGLARRVKGEWEVVVGDKHSFLDQNSSDITSAAISYGSEDSQWLMLGSKDSGIGIYDNSTHSWRDEIRAKIASVIGSKTGISFAVWFKEKFWVATDQNRIFTISIKGEGNNSDDIVVTEYRVPGQPIVRIKDFEVDHAQSCIWLLAERKSEDASLKTKDCSYLAKITGQKDAPKVVLDEKNIYPDLSNAAVQFIQQENNILVLAGEEGIFTYDLEVHSWSRVSKDPTFLFLRTRDNRGFYFAYGDRSNAGIGKYLLGQNTPPKKDYIGKAIKKLFYHPNGKCMALTDNAGLSNELYLVEESSENFEATQVYEGSYTQFDPGKFTSAVDLDKNGRVIFFGPEGILDHDVRRRSFNDIPKRPDIPEILFSDKIFVLRNRDLFFVFKDDLQGAEFQIMAVDDAKMGNYVSRLTRHIPLAKYLTAKKWDEKGFSIRTTDKNVITLPASDDSDPRVVGEPTNLVLNSLADAAQSGDSLWVTDGPLLYKYDMNKRSWEAGEKPAANGELKSLVFFDDTLLGETQNGQLADVKNGRSIIEAEGFIYGEEDSRTFLDDDELSDVYTGENTLYLAGEGRIWTYDFGDRSVGDKTWDLKSASKIKIVGLDGGDPVSWSRGKGMAFLGDELMRPKEDRVLNMSMSPNYIWTVRQGNKGERYLRADNRGGLEQARVFFKHPKPVGTAAGASRIMDAKSLGNGTICVLTDKGVALYYPHARSWVGVEGLRSILIPDRLYQLGNKKLVFEQKQKFGGGIDIKLINLPLADPDPVELSPIKLTYDELEETDGEDIVATAYDEENGVMAYVTDVGRVVEYDAGVFNPKETVLLPEAKQTGPKPSEELWRLYDELAHNDKYLFASKDVIWRYNTKSHLWRKFDLDLPGFPEPKAANVNIEFDGDFPAVNVKSRGGTYFVGSLRDGEVELEQVFAPRERFFTEEAGELLDVQLDKTSQGKKVWRFVLKGKVKSYSPSARRWLTPDIELGEVYDSVKYNKLRLKSEWKVIDGALTGHNNSNIVVIESNKGTDTKWHIHSAKDADGTIHPPTRKFSKYTLNLNDRVSPPLIDGEASIWRLDEKYKVIRMPYTEGQMYGKESKEWPEPFYINPNTIRAVYRWQDLRQSQSRRSGELLVFESSNGLRIYRPSTGKEILMSQEVKGFVGVQKIRNEGNQLWIKNDNGYLVLSLEDNDYVKGSRYSGIGDVVFDAKNNVWGREGTDWKLYESNSFVDPRREKANSIKIKVFARDGVPVTAVDDDGYIYYQKKGDPRLTKYTIQLPKDILPDKIHNIVHDNDKGDNWWVLTEGTLYHLLMVNVRVPLLSPDQLLPPDLAERGLSNDGAEAQRFPELVLPISGLPILAVQKKILVNQADFRLIKDAVAGKDNDAEGVVFCFNEKGDSRSIEWNSKNGYVRRTNRRTYGTSPHFVSNEWAKRSRWVKKLGNNRYAYDPIFDIQFDSFKDKIRFIRPSGTLYANVNGRVEKQNPFNYYLESQVPQLQPVLDAGWLAWNREKKEFNVSTIVNGLARMKGMPAGDLINEGRLFFEEIESLISFKRNKHWAANSFGIIEYPNKRLELDNRNISAQFVEIARPITGAHGRFVSGKSEYRLKQDGPINFTSLPQISLRGQGNVLFKENIISQKVEGHFLDVSKKPRAVFDEDGGFKFDKNRRSLAYSNVGLLVQSDAGVHPLIEFNGYDPGPGEAAMREGDGVLDGEGDKVYLKMGGNQWHVRNGVRWIRHSSNPSHDRICFKTPMWKWSLINSRMKIDLNEGNVHRFGYLTDGKIGFTSDQLKDAAAHKELLYLMTDAFFEAGVTINQLETISGLRDKPVDDLYYLRNLRDHSGNRLISKFDVNSFYEWNPVRRSFDLLNRDPYANVLLGENKNIRFRDARGKIHKELNVEGLDGLKEWVKFGFGAKGRFPFDEINSIATFRGQLYMGTGTGLQVYNNLPLDLNGLATHLMTWEVKDGGVPESVEWVGQPADSNFRNLIVARFSNDNLGAISTNNGRQWTKVSNPTAATSSRVRAISPMMRWSQNRFQKIQGVYSDENGAFDFLNGAFDFLNQSYRVGEGDGHLLHDIIRDFIDFESDSFTIWQTRGVGTMVTWHEKNLRGGTSNNAVKNFHFKNLGSNPLMRVDEQFTLFNGVEVKKGVYLKVGTGYKRFENKKFNDVKGTDTLEWLAERHRRTPVLSEERFRIDLDLENAALPKKFEYRKVNDNNWRQVDWGTIDQWDDCLFVGQSLWAASKGGLVQYQFDLSKEKNESMEFNYKTPLIITHELEGGRVTDFKQIGLGNFASIRFDGESDKVYRIDLASGKDSNVFKKQPSDEFSEEKFVSTGYWDWRLKDRVGNPPQGNLEGTHKTANFAKLEIDGGRFRMDKIHSVAVSPFKVNRLEMATEEGWFRFENAKFHVRDLLRPDDMALGISSIRHIGVIKKSTKDGKKRLIVADAEGKQKSIPEEGEEDDETDIREYQGEDSFWNYQVRRGSGKNRAIEIWTTRGRGNPTRTLQKGRFDDDFVVGLPAMEVNKSGKINYYVPTRAGIFKLNQGLSRLHLYGIDSKGAKPKAIAMMPNKSAGAAPHLTYIKDSSLHFYDANGSLRYIPLLRMPATAQTIEEGPYELATVGRMTPDGIRWDYLDKKNWVHTSPYIEVSNISEYKERKGAWRSLEAKIYYKFQGSGIEFWTQSSPGNIKRTQKIEDVPKKLGRLSKLIEYKTVNEGLIEVDVTKFFMIGREGMYEIDIEKLIEELTPSDSSRNDRGKLANQG